MLKEIIEKIEDCVFTSFSVEIDFEMTYLFIGIVLGFILTTAIVITYV